MAVKGKIGDNIVDVKLSFFQSKYILAFKIYFAAQCLCFL